MTIDELQSGQRVELMFCGSKELGSKPHTRQAWFAGIQGEGEDRRAWFQTRIPGDSRCYQWDAYRYDGDWAYGTSAERLRLIRVID